ncbi:MAG: hypothetical protein ACYDBQ_06620 [Thermoplasmatota archaeon]
MTSHSWLRSALAISVIAFASLPALGSATPTFPLRVSHFQLTADQGAPTGFAPHPLMKPASGAAGQAVFLPLLGIVGLPLDQTQWISDTASGATYGFEGDAIATIEFAPVNVDAVGTFTVELRTLLPDNSTTLVGSALQTFNLPRTAPATENFTLPTTGRNIPFGAALLLTLRADALDVLTVVNYGGASRSSLHLQTRLLDSNGNGIPDDVDACPPAATCPPASNGTYQYYYNYYAKTPGTGPPGAATGPAPPSGTPALPPAPNGHGNAAQAAQPWELYLGGGMGGATLLTALGGLFGRHAR